jgi:hypothetical protein
MKILRIYGIHIDGENIDIDCDLLEENSPNSNPNPNSPNSEIPNRPLPDGYNSDPNVGYFMLITSMNEHGLTPIGVQGHGADICKALNESWSGLNAYAHKVSDAIMWPGENMGSIDVTIDSGKGGWQFRPDGQAKYGEGR